MALVMHRNARAAQEKSPANQTGLSLRDALRCPYIPLGRECLQASGRLICPERLVRTSRASKNAGSFGFGPRPMIISALAS